MVQETFLDAQGDYAGGVDLIFKSPPQYHLRYCTSRYTDFPNDLPTETDMIWKIKLVRTSDVRLMIHCNIKEVLNVVISGTTCTDNRWSTRWSRDVEKIMFFSTDTASDYYRGGKLPNCDVLIYSFIPDKKNPIKIGP